MGHAINSRYYLDIIVISQHDPCSCRVAGVVTSAGCGDWAPRKLEKQRSVTFASIDLMEPIHEDLPQVAASVSNIQMLTIFIAIPGEPSVSGVKHD